MKTLIANKGILITITVFIVVLFLYDIFFKSEAIAAPSELSASSIGNDLLKMQTELQKVSFDQALFSSPSYLFLTDFSVDIPQQITGRPNPFNIIGQD